MQRLEVSGVVRLIYRSLGVKGLTCLSLFRILRFSGFIAAFIYSGCPGTNPDIYLGFVLEKVALDRLPSEMSRLRISHINHHYFSVQAGHKQQLIYKVPH